MKRELFRENQIWVRRSDDQVCFYRCFEALSSGLFCIHSQDFHTRPFASASDSSQQGYFLDFFAEQGPDDRNGLFSSLEEAIAEHDLYFSE